MAITRTWLRPIRCGALARAKWFIKPGTRAVVTYNIAAWEGTAPEDDAAATAEFIRRYDAFEDEQEPTPSIHRFVEALLARHPDLTELPDDEVDDSPWGDGPMIGNASGSFIYFSLVYGQAEAVLPFIV